jgi:hypothetical protein
LNLQQEEFKNKTQHQLTKKMKKLVLIAAVAITAISGFSQGTVNFNNRVTAAAIYAPIYGLSPEYATEAGARGMATTNGGTKTYSGAPILGTGFTGALFGNTAGTPEGGLLFIASAPFRTNANLAGVLNPAVASQVVPNVAIAGAAAVQIRAWDNRGGTITTWTAVMADPTIPRGSSPILDNLTTGGGASAAANLVGLQSFGLIVPVPEPSLIALGALGLGALLLRRRKA